MSEKHLISQSYLITQSLVSSWYYATSAGTEEAMESFLQTLRREPRESTPEMQAGLAFEDACYALTRNPSLKAGKASSTGAREIARIITGGVFQYRTYRTVTVDGTEYLLYGILDVLKAGVIYDIKWTKTSLERQDATGKYLDSPQHPFYFYLVPEAMEFTYLLSDEDSVYQETYYPGDCRSAPEIIGEFIHAITEAGLLELYHQHWRAK